MNTRTSNAQSAADLLQMMRTNTPGAQPSVVGMEALCRLTEGPKTMAQLCAETGCHKGTLIKQLHRFCVVFDQQTEELKVPNLRLIERTTRAEGLKGHIYELSGDGREFLKAAGILE